MQFDQLRCEPGPVGENHKELRNVSQPQKSTFDKVDGVICKVLKCFAYVSAACLVGIMLVAFFNVLGEKLRQAGLPVTGIPASTEIVQYLHIPVVFLAAAFVTLDRGHTNIDLLSAKFPKVLKKICNIFGYLVGIAISALVSWRGFIQMGKFITRHKMSSVSGVGFPLWPFALILAVGFVLVGVSFVWAIIREIAGYQPPAPGGPEAETPATEEGGEA